MMIPDRNILKKIKKYDPLLYVEWNSKTQYFEIWRKMENSKHVLVTPITYSIYEKDGPIAYCPMDERILWWLRAADSWQYRSSQDYALENDKRWRDFQIKLFQKNANFYRDMAKDGYSMVNNFYATKHQRKNDKPKFGGKRPKNKWLSPDMRAATSRRLFARSRKNALRYNFQR